MELSNVYVREGRVVPFNNNVFKMVMSPEIPETPTFCHRPYRLTVSEEGVLDTISVRLLRLTVKRNFCEMGLR